MRVSCPSCAATYDVPDAVLASGSRKLRCARCGHEWSPPRPAPAEPVSPSSEPPPPEPAAIAPARPTPAPPPPAKAPPQLVAPSPLVAVLEPDEATEGPGRIVVALAWTASLLLLGGLAAAAYIFRDTVQASWPPSRLVYLALGLG